MADQKSEIRYLTAPSIDTKKKKYCRFKKSGIKYIDYKDPEFLKKFLNEQGKNPSTSYHRYIFEVSAPCSTGCKACSPDRFASLRNRFDEVI